MTKHAYVLAGLLLTAACVGPRADSHYNDSPIVQAPPDSCVYADRSYPDGAVITPQDQPPGATLRCADGRWEQRRQRYYDR